MLNIAEDSKEIHCLCFSVRLVEVLQKGGCRGGLSPEKQPLESIRKKDVVLLLYF